MVHFDPYSRQHTDDPYPTYRRLRAEAPVYHNEERQFWALTRYDDVLAAFRDHRRFISSEGVTIERMGKGLPYLITRDPPDHSWHKALAVKVFSSRRMARLEPFIRARAIELIEALADHEEVDIFKDFTVRLPLDVISELIDIPPEYRAEIHHWTSRSLLRGEDGSMEMIRESHVRRRAIYLELIEARRRHPREDMITALIDMAVTDEVGAVHRFTNEEIAYHFSELASAGHETVAKAIPNALLALDEFPDERAKITARPARIGHAVEELLRWDAPSQFQGRAAACDVTLHGVTIPKGDMVMLVNGSATRDETAFADADRVDLDRKLDTRAIHFGFGIHKCLGIHLARVELRIALEEMFARFPDHKVHRERARRDIVANVRGVSGLPMSPGAHA